MQCRVIHCSHDPDLFIFVILIGIGNVCAIFVPCAFLRYRVAVYTPIDWFVLVVVAVLAFLVLMAFEISGELGPDLNLGRNEQVRDAIGLLSIPYSPISIWHCSLKREGSPIVLSFSHDSLVSVGTGARWRTSLIALIRRK